MNPDTTQIWTLLLALLHQALNSPAGLLDIAGLIVIAYVLEIWPKFNSAFIPIVCIIGGPCTYWLFTKSSSVPPEFPHPFAVLAVNGLIVGFFVSVVHAKLTKLVIAKIGSGMGGTAFLKKSDAVSTVTPVIPPKP